MARTSACIPQPSLRAQTTKRQGIREEKRPHRERYGFVDGDPHGLHLPFAQSRLMAKKNGRHSVRSENQQAVGHSKPGSKAHEGHFNYRDGEGITNEGTGCSLEKDGDLKKRGDPRMTYLLATSPGKKHRPQPYQICFRACVHTERTRHRTDLKP